MVRVRRGALPWAAALALLLPACRSDAPDGPVVLGAASLADALEAAGHAFESETGTPVAVRFGGSGWVAREIRQGAPADVFVSAHPALVTSLIDAGLADSASVRVVATNRLVVVVPPGGLGIAMNAVVAGALAGRRVALGDPDTVPAGTYAHEALDRMGVWETVSGDAVFTHDVRTALAMVEEQAVDAGIVYRSDALRSDRVRIAWTVPDSLHTPIRYTAVVVTGGRNPAGGAAFVQYLGTDAGRDSLSAYGLGVP